MIGYSIKFLNRLPLYMQKIELMKKINQYLQKIKNYVKNEWELGILFIVQIVASSLYLIIVVEIWGERKEC